MVLGVGLGTTWAWLVQGMSASLSPPDSELLGLRSYSPAQSLCLPGRLGWRNCSGQRKELDGTWVRLGCMLLERRYLGEAGLHAVGETWSEHTGVKSMSNRDFVYIGWGCPLWMTMIRLQRTRAVWFVFTTAGL